MKFNRLFSVLLAIGMLFALAGCGTIETGNVGIRTSLGKVSLDEEAPGFFVAVVSNVEEATVKEITVDLEKLTPKASDNLSLDRLDISVSYIPNSQKIADFVVNFKGQSYVDEKTGLLYPGFNMVSTIATGEILSQVAKLESLTIHTKRDALEDNVKLELQKQLDLVAPGMFKITRVVAKSIDTDDTIEESIQKVVKNQKELESMAVQEQIAAKQALIEIAKANGIAQANGIINHSLTKEYLQHEANLALMEFAKNPNSKTVVVPANMPVQLMHNAN